ncbi:MAG TPA: transposase [Gemmataceae bacterium]|nr:transposase [Gemmataceae bacterium]
MWTFVAGCFRGFARRPTGAATVLDELLTERFAGVVMCDRAKMYWSVGNVQWPWAHLQRDFQALANSADDKAQHLGRDLLRPTHQLFHWRSRCRTGPSLRGP